MCTGRVSLGLRDCETEENVAASVYDPQEGMRVSKYFLHPGNHLGGGVVETDL